jgi:isoquinoline 1-oxidoreductase beta subunit
VVCAVDCGIAINPDIVRAQVEGGIAFGLGVALHGRISLLDGRVEQSNFNDYTQLRISEMPAAIEVHFIDGGKTPTGIGEPGSVLIAAAVANAMAQLTGKPIRRLPLIDASA